MLYDRVRETAVDIGASSPFNLGGALSSNYRTFVAGVGDGKECWYVIQHRSAAEWEVGYGIVTDAATDTLTRNPVDSSNGGSLVTFSAGTVDVVCTAPASSFKADPTKAIGTVSSGTTTLDVANYGSFTYTNGGAHTLAFGTWPTVGTKYVAVTITNGGSATITWPTITWKTTGAAAPTLQSSGVDTLIFWKVGSVVYGAKAGV